ncbi:MAG TPA: hypothetical protein VLH79_08740 [Chthonomonadales bacterium]|nr:hypothetical protein [Chthonomonadales bacterium]
MEWWPAAGYALYVGLGLALTVWLLHRVATRLRALDRRIEEFREEQENAPPVHPLAALAELYEEESRRDEEARARRKARKQRRKAP